MTTDEDARYEFRCWPGTVAPYALGLKKDWRPDGGDEREDIYILPQGAPNILPKIRGVERLELKRRVFTDAVLEKWNVEFSEPFPVSAEKTAQLANYFPGADRLGDAGFDTPAEALSSLRTVCLVRKVSKSRRRYRRDACRAELTTVRIGPEEAASIALESQSRDAVLSAIQSLGVSGLPNVNYGAWLRESDKPLLRHG